MYKRESLGGQPAPITFPPPQEASVCLPPLVAELLGRHDGLWVAIRWSLLPAVGFSWVASRMGLCPALSLVGLVVALRRAALGSSDGDASGRNHVPLHDCELSVNWVLRSGVW